MSNESLDSLESLGHEPYVPNCRILTGDNEEHTLGDSCEPAWDSVLCWPRTKVGSMAVQACFEELYGIRYDVNQNASRWCWPNGTWNEKSNYSQCQELPQPEPPAGNSGIEITTTLYLVGYGLSLSTLIVAVVIYLYYRELKCLRNIIHTNLMFTYILANFLWIVMIVSQVTLETNIWMFVEGLNLYDRVLKTF